MTDRFFLGVVAGLAGAVVMVILNFLLNLIPGVQMELIFGISKLFVPQNLLGTLAGGTIGVIAHLICGSLVGLIFLVILEKTGLSYPVLKGAILGLGCWFVVNGLIGKFLDLGMQDKFIDNILIMLIHIPYGIITAWIIYRYHPKTFART
ncbi:hypothetical protein Tfer_1799 [Thermincola ferriacetica]|uniref:Uncharacterized protein n=1 Tax=Thermincola ferriacetica TaxID=281456 RepID=A0A0L6W393_9FIRM|nr:DUF6789 family protein [Thermincola ferriacetica]KNZ69554.1 hypothetical protein Tfer_1799 [Thermincola ferriacetica]